MLNINISFTMMEVISIEDYSLFRTCVCVYKIMCGTRGGRIHSSLLRKSPTLPTVTDVIYTKNGTDITGLKVNTESFISSSQVYLV